jgi:iron(III) transport system substrate-binding protein
MRITAAAALALASTVLLAACQRASSAAPESAPAREVNVYTGRHYDSDLRLFDAFTQRTGIRVNVIEAGGDALIERLAREAEASPADLFITADAGMLWRAKERGLLQPIGDQAILSRVPAHLRDRDAQWVGLSKRARVVIYNKEAGAPPLADYADLARPEFKGAICARSSTNVYNQSLLAWMIERAGADAASDWARGVVANFARDPEGNDTTQIEEVAAGRCRLALVNTYYVARYVGADDAKMRAIGEKIGVIFPNQDSTGTHVNISGAGVARHAPNPGHAAALIRFLLSDEAQRAFAAGNNEYPVVEGVAPVGPTAAFGPFRADDLDMTSLGEHQREAVMIFDSAGWR